MRSIKRVIDLTTPFRWLAWDIAVPTERRYYSISLYSMALCFYIVYWLNTRHCSATFIDTDKGNVIKGNQQWIRCFTSGRQFKRCCFHLITFNYKFFYERGLLYKTLFFAKIGYVSTTKLLVLMHAITAVDILLR